MTNIRNSTTYIHTYIYIHIHTYTHTNIQMKTTQITTENK